MTHDELPIACDRGGLTPHELERQKALVDELRGAVEERKDLPDGLAFRFPAERIPAIAELMAIERRCCAFLSLTLEVTAAESFVWLRLTGPEGTASVLRHELAL